MIYRKLTHKKTLSLLPNRDQRAHKGDMGRLLLLCGSKGFTGAAALAAMGALRAGAGLVFLGVPESIYAIEATKLTEPIVISFAEQNGMLAVEAIDSIDKFLSRMDAVLIGPGIGISVETEQVVKHVLEAFSGPIVLDADGITMMKAHKNVLRDRIGPTILTPHEGEFSRFVDLPICDRREDAEKLAKELGCIVALKGHETVITDGYNGYINKTGNPGMAVGGSGDVLAGVITALIGQGIPPLEAAAAGAWLHGAAGDICAKRLGQYGMLPSDMLGVLPRLMK